MHLQVCPIKLTHVYTHPPYLPLSVAGWKNFETVGLKIEEAWNPELLLNECHSEKRKKGNAYTQRHMPNHKHKENLARAID